MHRASLNRTAWKYKEEVTVPERYRKYLWDHPEGRAPLEKFIYRLLAYGRFEDIKWLYQRYPAETKDIVMRYRDIKRGVRFWINYWSSDAKALS